MTLPRVDTRSELLSLLTEACEIEHGLACVYLYAGFSLKQEMSEGLRWDEQQCVRKWAAQVYFVASQEMLHLAQAWNLLAAIGGTPYHGRPNFPQSAKYYPLGLPLQLRPFSLETLQLCIDFEEPEARAQQRRKSEIEARPDEEFFYRTVGELYSLIESGFENIPERELFVGAPSSQVGIELVDFPDVVRVYDVVSAKRAIERIRQQGEGAPEDRIDCHWGIFRQLKDELSGVISRDKAFTPARNVPINPVPRVRTDQSASDVAKIENGQSRKAAVLFDDVYGMMLRMLAYVFSNTTADMATLQAFSTAAIALMVTCVKPLGEGLTMLPLGDPHEPRRAGPSFGLSRHIALPAEPRIARILATERLQELATRAGDLARTVSVPQLDHAARALARIATSMRG